MKKSKKKEMNAEPECYCGKSGHYHCSVLREKFYDMRKVIRTILESDSLKSFAYERGDDDLSIYELCEEALKLPHVIFHDEKESGDENEDELNINLKLDSKGIIANVIVGEPLGFTSEEKFDVDDEQGDESP